MIKDITPIYLPAGIELSQATVNLPDMDAPTITTQVEYDGEVAPDFSRDWEVEFKGMRFIMPLRAPHGVKENTSLLANSNLTFQHWAVYQLKREFFFTIVDMEAGTVVPNMYIYPVQLNLGDFCDLFAKVLYYYFGDAITIRLNSEWPYDPEPVVVDISYSRLWNVLIKFNELFAVRWSISTNGSRDKYVINVGYSEPDNDHIFEYGFKGGLLKVERQVQDEGIYNEIMGRGGSQNLPYRYYKDVEPENDSFPADPDWIPELKNIYFTELRGATFRSYVQGWNHAHYKRTSVDSADKAYAPWAWMRGYTDEVFNYVEFVADGFTTENNGRAIVKGSSIDRYGILLGSLENNEEIYPTIQGIDSADHLNFFGRDFGRVDETIFVEQVISDDIEQTVKSEAQIKKDFKGISVTDTFAANARKSFTIEGEYFAVPTGLTGVFEIGTATTESRLTDGSLTTDYAVVESISIEVVNTANYQARSASGIPSGSYRYRVKFTVYNSSNMSLRLTVAFTNPTLVTSDDSPRWANTFDILVKDLWASKRESGESDIEFARRVWGPILGDHLGGEAKVVFTDGELATNDDYEFTIVDIPKYHAEHCSWETVVAGKVVKHEYDSMWRITLAKSDADLESLNLYVPSTMRQGKAGDHFIFTGIDLPHAYVVWGEEELDNYKKDALDDCKDIKPTWVVSVDRVRAGNEGKADALLEAIRPGAPIRLSDKRFITRSQTGTDNYETLYISSVTYTYREPTSDDNALNCDIEIVLSDKYETSASPVATISSEVEAISRQLGSISNIEQIVRRVGDRLYLRKDGIADRSASPTQFTSLVTSTDFQQGMVGGAGWGIYIDENGHTVVETDVVRSRNAFEVNSLVVNQVQTRGGMIIESDATMVISRVVETPTAYMCYFDQHLGSVANLFTLDDIAYCNRFYPDNSTLKYYKRRVVEVGIDYIALSKNVRDGDGIPAVDDNLVQYGNYNNINRQHVIIRDVMGGGYERMLTGLNSVTATGKQYYFVGRQSGMYNNKPYYFLGDKDAQYIEMLNGKITSNMALTLDSTVDGSAISDFVNRVVEPLTPNMLYNTAFADGSNFWTSYKNIASVCTEESHKFMGYNSVYLNAHDLKMDTYAGITQSFAYGVQSLRVTPGKAYTWSFYARIDDKSTLDGAVGGNFSFVRENGVNAVTNSSQIQKELVEGQWVRITRTFVAPDNVYSALFSFWFQGNGQLYIALPQLQEGTKATPWVPNPMDSNIRDSKTDYLREAFALNSTSVSGGLIMSSTILAGYRDYATSDYYVMAGVNGIYRSPETLAFFSGGDMIDAATNPDSKRAATFAIRMDGTGYAAGNTLRFKQGAIGVANAKSDADLIVLDGSGLHMLDSEGNETLRVGDFSIDNSFLDGVTPNVNLGASLSGDVLIADEYYNTPIVAEGLELMHNYYVARNYEVKLSTSDRRYSAGTHVQAGLTLNVNFTGGTENLPLSVMTFVELRQGSIVVGRDTKYTLGEVGSPIYISHSANFNIDMAGDYDVYVGIQSTGSGTANSFTAPFNGTASGRASRSTSAKTTIGRNGFATMWGQAVLLANADRVIMRHGLFGLQVSGNGIQYNKDGTDTNWTDLV